MRVGRPSTKPMTEQALKQWALDAKVIRVCSCENWEIMPIGKIYDPDEKAEYTFVCCGNDQCVTDGMLTASRLRDTVRWEMEERGEPYEYI